MPPGGGGRRLSPPEPGGRGFADPLFLVGIFCEGRKAALRGSLRITPPPKEVQGNLTPMLSLMVWPSLKPRSSLGRLSSSWDSLERSVSCFTHLRAKGSRECERKRQGRAATRQERNKSRDRNACH